MGKSLAINWDEAAERRRSEPRRSALPASQLMKVSEQDPQVSAGEGATVSGSGFAQRNHDSDLHCKVCQAGGWSKQQADSGVIDSVRKSVLVRLDCDELAGPHEPAMPKERCLDLVADREGRGLRVQQTDQLGQGTLHRRSGGTGGRLQSRVGAAEIGEHPAGGRRHSAHALG